MNKHASTTTHPRGRSDDFRRRHFSKDEHVVAAVYDRYHHDHYPKSK